MKNIFFSGDKKYKYNIEVKNNNVIKITTFYIPTSQIIRTMEIEFIDGIRTIPGFEVLVLDEKEVEDPLFELYPIHVSYLGYYFPKNKYPEIHEYDDLTQLILENKKNKKNELKFLGIWYVLYLIEKGKFTFKENKTAIISPPSYRNNKKEDHLSLFRKYLIHMFDNRLQDFTNNLIKTRPVNIRKDKDPKSIYAIKDSSLEGKFLDIDEIWILDDIITTGKTMTLLAELCKRLAPNAKFSYMALAMTYNE